MALLSLPSVPAFYDAVQRAIHLSRYSYHWPLVPILARLDARRFLELGCGSGSVIRCLRPGIRYVGVDPNANFIRYARDRFSDDRFEFVHSDALTFLAKDTRRFDCVLLVGSIHHMSDNDVRLMLKHVCPRTRWVVVQEPVRLDAYPLRGRLQRWYEAGDWMRGEDDLEGLWRRHKLTVEHLQKVWMRNRIACTYVWLLRTGRPH